MNQEIASIVSRMEEVFAGHPWYGKSILTLFEEIDPLSVYFKPTNNSHSIIQILFHMLTWQQFTLSHLEKIENSDSDEAELLDWRETMPELHTWNNGYSQFVATHNKIVNLLKNNSDEMLTQPVKNRDYNSRFLLNGLIQHNIYHLGQIGYIKNLYANQG